MTQRSRLPAGPRAPAAVQTARWLMAPIGFMESCRQRYGDAFSVRFLGFERPMVMLSDPRAIRALYLSREHRLSPGRTIALLPIMGAHSVALLEGREHLERRRLMLPAFHGERMRAYEPLIEQITGAEVDGWQLRTPFSLHPPMRAVTLEVILRTVFGVSERGRLERLRELLARLLDGTSSPAMSFRVLLARRLGRPNPLERFAALHGEIDELLLADIAQRRADPAGTASDDILSLLLAARFEDGGAMSDRELRDQLVTLLLAGHETTATALAWTFDLLLAHPAALARLRAELQAGDEAYLRAVISESLRLRPVLPLAGRRLEHDLDAAGLHLPAGTDVTPAIWLIHHRGDLYPRPHEFRPERFLDQPLPTYAWIPFGGGVRRCLGAAFAELEMRVVLRTVLGRVDLEPVAVKADAVARRNVTFVPRHGTRVRVTRTTPAPATAAA